MSGWLFAFGQNLLLLVVAALLGLLVGYVFARSDRGRGAPAARAGKRAGVPAGPAAAAVPAPLPDPGNAGAGPDAQTTVLTALSPAGAHPQGGPVLSGPAIDVEYVHQLERELAEAREQVVALTERARQDEIRAGIEYGRLEAAALRTLDDAIAAGQERIARLDDELSRAREAQAGSDRNLLACEQQAEALRSALAERDARIVHMDNEINALRLAGTAAHVEEGPR